MPATIPTINFVRRGYSPSGGAEAYLKRLGSGVAEAGYAARLIATRAWPNDGWMFGEIARVKGESPRTFADDVGELTRRDQRGVVMSLERIWECDVYRAGDGVHAAWLERRAKVTGPLRNFVRRFRSKHDDVVELEKSLFAKRAAGRVIVNSEMVREEIVRFYGYPAERIILVRNGIPVAPLAAAREHRDAERATLGLGAEDYAVLFVGSGWERKGLRSAIDAVETLGGNARLLVAGRGDQRKFRSARTQFLGVRDTMNLYAAADVFLLPTIYDPFSNACLEALAAGLPVITTTANGFAEITTSGVHGSTIGETADTKAIADALRFWADFDRRKLAITANAELAAKYDIAANVSRTLEILLQTADNAAST